jgi:hypothetical protein
MFAVIGLAVGAGAGAGAVCAIAPLARVKTARASVVFLNVFINVPYWLNKKITTYLFMQ